MRMIILSIFALFFAVAHAQAEAYYIELGRAASEAEAVQIWGELQAKNKTLAAYDVFPNAILQADGSFAYRVQAGPMLEKKEAQRVCNRLFKRKISCFVIEGFDPQNIKSFGGNDSASIPEEIVPQITQEDFVLPWLAEKPEAPPQTAFEEPALPEPPTQIKPSGEAKAEVAEAIIVSLTSDDNQVITIAEPVQIASVEENSPTEAPIAARTETDGWLNIQPFLNAQKANEFFGELKQLSPSQTQHLSSQTIAPSVSHDIPKVILSIKGFANEADAMQFCSDFITRNSTYLECQFSEAPPSGTAATNEVRRPFAESKPAANAADEEEVALYWVEVLNTKTQNEALAQWETIRTDNDDLLARVRSQITTSLENDTRFVVRIGPMNAKSKASKLCRALSARGVACKLTSL